MKDKVTKIIGLFCMSLLLVFLAGMHSEAAELNDENSERLETVYGMDEEGNIFVIDGTAGIVEESGTYVKNRAASAQVVNFNINGNSVTEYKEYVTSAAGYTNGAYGADAAYLGEENGYVIFMLSGVIGKVDASKVQVVDFSDVKTVSYYIVEDGNLKHRIAHKVTETSYSSLVNGKAPSYLKEGVKYYSYDGHYFYKDYAVMIADYQSDTRNNSVNPKNPYYNYYQFLPMRSRTEYTADEIYNLVNAKVTDTSKLRNKGRYFVQYQNTYGVNGLIMTGIAANESAWGTSSICNNKNNLFGINAVDSSPGTSANTFASIQSCIKQFAETYMSKRYLRPGYTYYHGGYLGNKASGINVSYASDPYWGEKAANIIYTLDKNGGNKDAGIYTIGIKNTISKKETKPSNVIVRNESSTEGTKLYTTGNVFGYAVLLQKSAEENGFYKIQCDGVLDADRTVIDSSTGKYNFGKMYAYISANYVDVVHEGNDITLTSLSTPKLVSATHSGGKVTFKWNKVDNAKGYYVYRKVGTGSYSRVKTITSGSTLKYTDSNVAAGKKYTYTVRAYHKSIWSSYKSAGVSVTIPTKTAVTYTKYKTTTSVNYRSGAGTSYAKKGTLAKGKVISVEDGYSKTANGYTWVRFKLNGKNYYVAKKYLTKYVTYTKYKTTSKVNYRSGAGTSYAKKGTLAKGKVISVENGYSKTANGYTWVRFKLNGNNYYVAKKYLKKQ